MNLVNQSDGSIPNTHYQKYEEEKI